MKGNTSPPAKTYTTCGREFTWRRKWRLNWNNVLYCSRRCQRQRRSIRAVSSIAAR